MYSGTRKYHNSRVLKPLTHYLTLQKNVTHPQGILKRIKIKNANALISDPTTENAIKIGILKGVGVEGVEGVENQLESTSSKSSNVDNSVNSPGLINKPKYSKRIYKMMRKSAKHPKFKLKETASLNNRFTKIDKFIEHTNDENEKVNKRLDDMIKRLKKLEKSTFNYLKESTGFKTKSPNE